MSEEPKSNEYTGKQSSKKPGMPFLVHLEELRWRLLKSVISVIVMAAVAFIFRNELFAFLILPLGETQLHFTDVTGSF